MFSNFSQKLLDIGFEIYGIMKRSFPVGWVSCLNPTNTLLGFVPQPNQYVVGFRASTQPTRTPDLFICHWQGLTNKLIDAIILNQKIT
jgi:hypothetical protein